MGVRIIYDARQEHACLYDSVSDVAFGPVFYGYDSDEQAELFAYRYLARDARTYSERELLDLYHDWSEEFVDEETGTLNDKGQAAWMEVKT